MIIDTTMTIAYKCSSCGTFDYFGFSLFKLFNKKQQFVTCRCKNSGFSLGEAGGGRLKAVMPCLACGGEHRFILDCKEILTKGVITIFCPNTGIHLCFIGNDILVRRKIDALEKELDEMIDTLGYDNYFKNTRVMFDSLNRIHDIAEQGNLICECGSEDIELILFSDKIKLKCSRCPGSSIIQAASNEDLKKILRTKQIFLRGLQNTI
ncbi:MAG: hypothetical protein N2489_06590 [Clostridia bacterium]|nr:hypothetical protein [Clostridia bacterium]